jgi:hypothetical protein
MIRYLLDENVDPIYRTELVKREPTIIVWKVGTAGAPSLHALDPEILDWCNEHEFILITNNRRSMPTHLRDHLARGGRIPGIFILNPTMTAGDTIQELLLIWGASLENEYQDRIAFLPFSY